MPSRRRASVRELALALAVLGLLGLVGCRSQPLLRPAPIYSPLGAEQNRQAILRGMTAHRWVLVSEEPGIVTARYDKRHAGRFVATVDLVYDDDGIEIRYRDSHGLLCDTVDRPCETIHRAYNRWVVQLSRDIEYGVQTVRLESLGERPVGAAD